MFTMSQDSGSFTQATTPTSTTIVNQSAAVCGTSITVSILVKTKTQLAPFKVHFNMDLPNQPGQAIQACQ
jgi:hypothetical protein